MPLMPLDVQFRVLINDFLPRLHGHEIYDDTNGFINYVQNGTPKMPHRGYLLHYYILGSVKLLQSWLTSYKEGLGLGRNIYQNMWRCPNCIEKQDKKLLRVTQNRKGSSVVGSKLQCSDVITSHLSLAMCHVWGPGVSWQGDVMSCCTPLAANPGSTLRMPHLRYIYPSFWFVYVWYHTCSFMRLYNLLKLISAYPLHCRLPHWRRAGHILVLIQQLANHPITQSQCLSASSTMPRH